MAIAPHMGRLVINARASIISKPFVIPRLQQPRPPSPYRSKKSQPLQRRASTGSNSSHGKGGGNQHQKKKMPKKPPKQEAYEVTFKNSGLSEVTMTSGGERER